jgi:hypothetical protein
MSKVAEFYSAMRSKKHLNTAFITIMMPVLRVGILPRGNVIAGQGTIGFVMTARDWIEKGDSSAFV